MKIMQNILKNVFYLLNNEKAQKDGLIGQANCISGRRLCSLDGWM